MHNFMIIIFSHKRIFLDLNNLFLKAIKISRVVNNWNRSWHDESGSWMNVLFNWSSTWKLFGSVTGNRASWDYCWVEGSVNVYGTVRSSDLSESNSCMGTYISRNSWSNVSSSRSFDVSSVVWAISRAGSSSKSTVASRL
mgnify:CR=1 FL=1